MNYLDVLRKITFLVFGLLFICICSCNRVQNMIGSEPQGAMDTAPIRVTFIYPGDCLGDLSYCDILHKGAAEVKRVFGQEGVEVNEMVSNFETWDIKLRAAAENSGLVLTSGYQMGDPVSRVAPEFPEVIFVVFDAVVDLPNVVSVSYRVNEGTFLLGAIAGLKTQTGKVGYLGGANVPLLHEFEAGYLAGVKAVNPEAEIVRGYVADDQEGFYNPVKGREIAAAQYDSGVDVIYAMADQSGFGAVEAAKMAEGRYVIWNYIDISDMAPGIILTALRVDIDAAAYTAVKEFVAGRLVPGVYSLGLGISSADVDPRLPSENFRGVLSNQNVGFILPSGNFSLVPTGNYRELLPDELLEKVEALKASIVAGEITVPTVPETGM